MKKTRLMVAAAAICFVVGLAIAAETSEPVAKAEKREPAKITVRKLEAQTVLYTVYRGLYEKIGRPIGELYALAGKNVIILRGAVRLVYLNNPATVSPEHYLTEIRIPVGDDARKLAGMLGAMTDVKSLRAHEVAVVQKAPGDMDYAGIYGSLHAWMVANGYRSMDDAMEVFGPGMDFEKTSSEIMVPVVKAEPKQ
jgi:hypothetical protein